MTRVKMLAKLSNAIQAKRGWIVSRPKGRSPAYRDQAPQPHAQNRIDRWRLRIKQKGGVFA